jgi:dihydrofolate reductase
MNKRKLILSMQITLDGYVAGPNDEADWLISDDQEWEDLFNELSNVDTYLLGRKMYPLYSKYWQSVLQQTDSPPNELKFAKLADQTHHIVFTKGDFHPDWHNTTVAHDVTSEVNRLKKEEGKNILAWGGANFASSLIELDLVDEIRLAWNPTILSSGKALFDNLRQRKKFTVINAKTFDSGLTVVRYQL